MSEGLFVVCLLMFVVCLQFEVVSMFLFVLLIC